MFQSMGYRTLLAEYMRHVEDVVGTNLVEIAALTNSVSARDLGELRTIAAQMRRDSHEDDSEKNLNEVVHQLLLDGDLRLEQLAALRGFDPSPTAEDVPSHVFSRTLLNLVKFQETEQ